MIETIRTESGETAALAMRELREGEEAEFSAARGASWFRIADESFLVKGDQVFPYNQSKERLDDPLDEFGMNLLGLQITCQKGSGNGEITSTTIKYRVRTF